MIFLTTIIVLCIIRQWDKIDMGFTKHGLQTDCYPRVHHTIPMLLPWWSMQWSMGPQRCNANRNTTETALSMEWPLRDYRTAFGRHSSCKEVRWNWDPKHNALQPTKVVLGWALTSTLLPSTQLTSAWLTASSFTAIITNIRTPFDPTNNGCGNTRSGWEFGTSGVSSHPTSDSRWWHAWARRRKPAASNPPLSPEDSTTTWQTNRPCPPPTESGTNSQENGMLCNCWSHLAHKTYMYISFTLSSSPQWTNSHVTHVSTHL